MSAARPPLRAALLVMLASGFAGLGYQIVWTQQASLWLGHESAAVLAVVAAFFGGLALGALTLGARVACSTRPARWYAACEAVIALWSLVLAALLTPATQALLAVLGPQPSTLWHWSASFAGTFLLLLPATAAMGATLPAMDRLLMRRGSMSVGALYAANTAGAVLGVLAAAFVLVPQLGLLRTAGVCAALNGLCAMASLRWLDDTHAPALAAIPAGSRLPLLLGATGLLGIAYEVVVVRVLSQVAENTVYTFAILLAVYLLGTTLGAAAYASCPARDTARQRDRLLCALALSVLSGALVLGEAAPFKAWLLHTLGAGMTHALISEATLALAAFLLPTVLMGALFSLLAAQARDAGTPLGRALGVNTLGAAAAPLLVGLLIVPQAGARTAVLLIAAAYAALALRSAWRRPAAWFAAAVVPAAAMALPSLAIVDLPPGGRVAFYAEGVAAAVSVIENADGVRHLHIDNRQQEGSNVTRYADARQALLPLLLHPAPRNALFLGLGTGVTAASAASEAGLNVDAVELLPEVIAASAGFTQDFAPEVRQRLHLKAADARRYVRTAGPRYDLIVADNFHPARSGSGALYTVEHFSAVRARLADDGVFCQWLPLHQLDLGTLRSIVRSYLAVFPHTTALLASNSLDTPTIGLVARAGDAGFALAPLRTRLQNIALPEPPAAYGLPDDLSVFGSFFAGPAALARFAGDAPLNTDDRPVVAYRAPRATYAPGASPRERLLALLRQSGIGRGELLTPPAPEWEARLAAYRNARDQYLQAGASARPAADARAMLQQVQGPLLAVLRTSPDFRPAYEPLLRMAQALYADDGDAACELLARLQAAAPQRPDAAEAQQQLCAAR